MTSTSSAPAKSSSGTGQIAMEAPDGQRWFADSEADALNLQAGHGYKRLDSGPPAAVGSVPATGARAETAEANPPPKSGAGSGRDAWAAYAEQRGVTVADGSSRDDIVAALDQAGQPTEAPAS